MAKYKYIRWFDEIRKTDVELVGGKGANLGELTHFGLPVPQGFCVTAEAYDHFIDFADLKGIVEKHISAIDVENTEALMEASKTIQNAIKKGDIEPNLEKEIRQAYEEFCNKYDMDNVIVAVRSSATAEDLPDASFAGQQDTYLHVSGADALVEHVRYCWASLWTSRAIYYRQKQDFDHFKVSLSTVIQKMVNSEKSGVMFTANPVTSDTNQIMINASYGLGEAVVSGAVTPDEYILDKKTGEIVEENIASKNVMVIDNHDENGTRLVRVEDELGKEFVTKECLTKEELKILFDMGLKVEELYGSVQDTEWAFDKDTKEFNFLQSRPITTLNAQAVQENDENIDEEEELISIVRGLPAAPGIGRGTVKIIHDISEIDRIQDGDILITTMTNPDMVPAMRKAVAVVTDEGGRTCHAAIVSRELQIPCIVGAVNATEVLKDGQEITVDATLGVVYEGFVLKNKDKKKAPGQVMSEDILSAIENITAPVTATKIYMNLGEPELIDRYKNLPIDGIGLMRTEFIFTNYIGVHPMYLVKTGRGQLMIDKLAEGIQKVAQPLYPRNVVVRMSDFRTNEFRGLEGGDEVEPIEANPMIGWRGVSRYISPAYEEGFRLECKALKKVREEFGLTNVIAMLPFVRTPEELVTVKEIMAEEGLVQSKNFKIWIMAEVPAVVMQADEFAQLVDGFSIGSNDLTQLTMGADRDSGILNNMGYFDERNTAVKRALKTIVTAARNAGITCSICGQGPSQYPELAEFLVECGITSMSVNPDTVVYTRKLVASVEKKIMLNKLRTIQEHQEYDLYDDYEF